MNPRRVIACAVALSCVFLAGCDDPADQIQPTIPDTAPPVLKPEKPQPATQALLSGPRTTLALDALPLTMRVPEGFEIVSVTTPDGREAKMLEGFAPSGKIACRLTALPSTTPDDLKLTLERLDRERAKLMPGETTTIRESGGMKIVEQRGPSKASAAAATQPSDPYGWRVTFYTPDTINLGVYEISFLGLSVEQVQQDEAFFRGLIDSIAPAGGSSPATKPDAAVR